MMPIDTRRLHTCSSCLASADERRLVRWTNGCDCDLFGLWYCCADERIDMIVGIASAPDPAVLWQKAFARTDS